MSLKSPFTTKIERGSYQTIVYQEGDLCVAEDDVGRVIKENTDDATVIQAAIDDLSEGTLFIKKGDYTIPSANINLDTINHRINIEGEGSSGYYADTAGTKLTFSNGHGIYITGNGWFNQIRNIRLIGDGTGKAISNDTPAGNFNSIVFEDIVIKNFATGIELNKSVLSFFRNIYIAETTKGFRLPGSSWSPYLENVSAGFGVGSEEGIYIHWADRAYLGNCSGEAATTFTYQLSGWGITILSPYSEYDSAPMRLTGTGIKVLGGRVRSNVYLGYDGEAVNVYLDMLNYYNRNEISFTLNPAQDCSHVVIDIGSWTPTVTDTNNRALIRSTVDSGANSHYIKYSGCGHHFNDLLAIPTSLPTYGLIAGTMYFDTSTKGLKVYDGTAWKSVTLT